MKTICHHCKNEIGFVCGTCLECGFNYIEKKFSFIKVYVSDLPIESSNLILKHALRTENKCKPF